MMEVRLTGTQERALSLAESVAVTAGAGSGKTRVLIERYLRILDQYPNLGPANILAITFTEKAAAEMRNRVREYVLARMSRGGEEAPRWRRVWDALPAAHISTIHGFCFGLLMRRPLEAGIGPEISPMTEADERVMRADEIHEAIRLMALDGDRDLRTLLAEWTRRQLEEELEALISNRVQVDSWLRTLAEGSTEADLARWEVVVGQGRRKAARTVLADAEVALALASLREVFPSGVLSPGSDMDRILSAAVRLSSGADIEEVVSILQQLVDLLLTRKGTPAKRVGPRGVRSSKGADICEAFAAAIAPALAAERHWLTAIPGAPDRHAAALLAALSRVYGKVLERYELRKKSSAFIDFEDMLLAARDLLKADAGGIRSQCLEQFNYILVDEFQDTNHLQWEIMRLLSPDDAPWPPGRVLIVGDPKQSIYAFRGAEVETFQTAKAGMVAATRGTACEVSMNENFRAAEELIHFANQLFAYIMGLSAGPACRRTRREPEPFEPEFIPLVPARRPASDRASSGTVKVLVTEPDIPGAEGARSAGLHEKEARMIAAHVRASVEGKEPLTVSRDGRRRPATYEDFAILLRQRTHLKTYEEQLREFGVPFFTVGGLGFWERQEVLDGANLLRFLSDPTDDLALVGVLRSPFFAFSDEGLMRLGDTAEGQGLWEKLERLSGGNALPEPDRSAADLARNHLGRLLQLADRVPHSELLSRALEETGAWGSYAGGPRGNQALVNLRKLIAMCRQASTGSRLSLSELVERLESGAEFTREEEAPLELEGMNAVRIMTIHGAKALEFPVVIVADLSAPFRLTPRNLVAFDREFGPTTKGLSREYRLVSTALRDIVIERNRARTLAEEKRLLYVAVTRAMDHLVLSGISETGHGGSRSIEDARSFADWVLAALNLGERTQAGMVELRLAEGLPPGRAIVVKEVVFPAEAEPREPPAYLEIAASLRAGVQPLELTAEAKALQESRAPIPQVPSRRYGTTEIADYHKCPYRYFLLHRVGLAPRPPLMQDGRMGPDPLAFGTAVHAVFAAGCLSDVNHLRKQAERQVRLLGSLAFENQQEIVDRVVHSVQGFQDTELYRAVTSASEIRTELPFCFLAGDALVTGRVDLMYRRAENGWAIVDFKTDRIAPSEVPSLAADYRLQLGIYALAARKVFKNMGLPISAVLYFTEPRVAHSFEFGEREFSEICERIEAATSGIRDGKFPVSPNVACRFCPYGGGRFCSAGPFEIG